MQHYIAVTPPPDIATSLREIGSHHVVGPHITVKAQAGLRGVNKSLWLEDLKRGLVGFGPVQIQLGSIASFGTSVAYLEVTSPRLNELHDLLMEIIAPTDDDAVRYYELDNWTPHLTVDQGTFVDVAALRSAVDRLSPLPSFSVDEVVVCRQDQPAQFYVPDTYISLR